MLARLQVTHLRNITHADLHLSACNVFIGENGSGKTSLLEAVFLLSRGKSFRHHQPKRYIQHHQPAVTVYAKLGAQTVGLTDAAPATMAIQKQVDATTILRLNQSTVYTQSALTQQLPTMLIDPSSMDMLEQGSANRRQLLDWLAFHMKPGFHPQWLAYQRLLKQRNRLLKQCRQLTSQQRQELAAWDKGLASHAALIHHYRQHVFEAWQPYFQRCVQALLPRYSGKISLSYHPGYDASTPLDEQLQARMAQDLQQGFTRIGSHRADIQVYWRSERDQSVVGASADIDDLVAIDSDAAVNMDVESEHNLYADIDIDAEDNDDASISQPRLKEQAANVLSRGEKKLLITALKLSQLPLLLADTEATSHLAPTVPTNPAVEVAATSSDNIFNNEASIRSASPLTHNRTAITNNDNPLGYTPVVLLDDITAELDTSAVKVLLSTLAGLPCQVFITSLTADILPLIASYWPDYQLFHVKQGQLQLATH